MPKQATKEEKKHMGRISQLPCCVCHSWPVEVHHVRSNTGMGVRPSHFDTISLCFNHHRGQDGIHTIGKKTWEARFGTQQQMLERTSELLNEQG